MSRKITLLFCCLLFTFSIAVGQSIDDLRKDINQFLKDKNATVGVAIQGMEDTDTLSVNGTTHLPMQSVFKFHLALLVLHQVDQKKFDLNDTFSITKSKVDTYKHLYSPLIKKFPNGTEISIGEVLEYSVALSDNLACDLLFEKVGGTKALQTYMHSLGIKDIAVEHIELSMQANWQSQYENWTTPKAANQALRLFYNNPDILSEDSYEILLNILKGTKTGGKSIKGLLPTNTVVAHKTGYSGINDQGVIGAFNNIGIVFLPNDTYFYISVFVSDSSEDFETSQAIIAEVSKMAWDYFSL